MRPTGTWPDVCTGSPLIGEPTLSTSAIPRRDHITASGTAEEGVKEFFALTIASLCLGGKLSTFVEAFGGKKWYFIKTQKSH
jgi:hypothetical protein